MGFQMSHMVGPAGVFAWGIVMESHLHRSWSLLRGLQLRGVGRISV
jgi:hypothetical protein